MTVKAEPFGLPSISALLTIILAVNEATIDLFDNLGSNYWLSLSAIVTAILLARSIWKWNETEYEKWKQRTWKEKGELMFDCTVCRLEFSNMWKAVNHVTETGHGWTPGSPCTSTRYSPPLDVLYQKQQARGLPREIVF